MRSSGCARSLISCLKMATSLNAGLTSRAVFAFRPSPMVLNDIEVSKDGGIHPRGTIGGEKRLTEASAHNCTEHSVSGRRALQAAGCDVPFDAAKGTIFAPASDLYAQRLSGGQAIASR